MAREKLKLNAAALQVPIGLEEHHRWVWAWSYEVLLGQRESRGCGGLLEDGHGGWYCELSLQAKELSQKGSFFSFLLLCQGSNAAHLMLCMVVDPSMPEVPRRTYM